MPSAQHRTASVPRWLAASLAFTLTAVTVAALPATAEAAPAPAFDCSEPRFFAQAEEPIGTTQLYEGSYTASGGSLWSTLGPTVTGADLYNAIAFNPVDEHIYGTTYGVASARGKFVRIDRSGVVTNLGVSAPSMATETYSTLWDSGEFDSAGNYYVASGNAGNAAAGTIYKVAGLAASTGSIGTQPSMSELTLSPIPDYADFSFKDGYLWTHNYGNANLFYRINTTTGAVDSYSSLGVLPIGNYGSVFTMTNGNLAFIDTAAKMHQVAITDSTSVTPTFELVSTVAAPANQRSDATNCSTAQQAELSVVKSGPATVVRGEQIQWTITVTNDGPGVSSGFVAIDTLPAGVTGAVATSADSSCGPQGGLIVCNGGRLAVGESAVITLTATAPMTVGAIANTVRVVGNEDSTPSTSLPAETEVALGTMAGGSDTAELDLGPAGAGWAVTDGAHGTVENDGGNLVYTPSPSFSGVDHFTYTDAGGSPVVVYVTVVPKALPDAVTTSLNLAVTGTVQPNDSGVGLQFAKATDPANGSVVVNLDGTFTYTPNLAFVGVDSFTYTVTGAGGSATAAVTVTVLAAPIAVTDLVTTSANIAVGVDVLANDSGDALTAALLAAPGHGTAVDNGDSTFTYIPGTGFSGADLFTYTLTGSGGSATGTVQVTITPVAGDDSITIVANTIAAMDVSANDAGSNLSVSLLTAPTNGSVTLLAGGAMTYRPTIGYSGIDSFRYQATDAAAQTATATVSIAISPVAAPHSSTAAAGTPVTVGLLTDAVGTGLVVTSVTQPANGSVVLNLDGTARYTPRTGFAGLDTFSYVVTDTDGQSVTSAVTIRVTSTAPAGLAATGAEPAGLLQLGAMLVLIGAALLARRPRRVSRHRA